MASTWFEPVRTIFDLFTWLEADAAADLRARMRRRSFDRGQSVYAQGEPGNDMYRVANGFVRLSVQHADGRQVVFLLFAPGDFFGASTPVDGEPRPQTAEAITPLQVDVLCRSDFDRMRAVHPSFDLALMRLLSRQMRVASKYLVGTQLNSLGGRLAGRLLEIASMAAEVEGLSEPLPLRISQSELAEMVGASRQSVNKLLQRFQDNGLIELIGGKVIISDLIGLSRSAE